MNGLAQCLLYPEWEFHPRRETMRPFICMLLLPACYPSIDTYNDLDTSVAALAEPAPVVEPITTDPPVKAPEIADVEEVEPVYAFYDLKRGETLAHFARWSGLSLEEVAEASGLDLGGDYPVGTALRIPLDSVELQAQIDERREAHRTRRVDAYVAGRGGTVGTDFFTVRTGDTAWSIARDAQGIPVWVLEAYNPTANLDSLQPGQELLVPVLADIVVDAE